MIMLFVFVVMECIVQVMAYLTRKWLASCPHGLLFGIWSGVCPCSTFFLGGGHFMDIDIIGFQKG